MRLIFRCGRNKEENKQTNKEDNREKGGKKQTLERKAHITLFLAVAYCSNSICFYSGLVVLQMFPSPI